MTTGGDVFCSGVFPREGVDKAGKETVQARAVNASRLNPIHILERSFILSPHSGSKSPPLSRLMMKIL
jgi:hypothetical protein